MSSIKCTTCFLLPCLILGAINISGAQFAYQWGFGLGGSSTDRTTAMCIDPQGNVIVTGIFSNSMDFDPSADVLELTGDARDAFLCKYSSQGNLLWVRNINMDTDDGSPNQLPDVSVDPQGNILVGGAIGSFSASNIYVAKYDPDGNLLWDFELDGGGKDYAMAVCALPDGSCAVTGYFGGTIDFDPGPEMYELTSSGANDLFIGRYGADGGLMWAKNIGGSSYSESELHYITTNEHSDIYLGGSLHFSFDFDPGNGTGGLLSGGPGTNPVVAKYDAQGNFLWARQIVSSGQGSANEMRIDRDRNLVVAGEFGGVIDFGFGPDTAVGIVDIFLAKYTPDGEPIWAFTAGSQGFDSALSLAIDQDNNIHLLSYIDEDSPVDADPSAEEALFTCAGVYDMLYTIYDENSQYLDGFSLGGVKEDVGISAGIDFLGNCYVAGWYASGQIDVDMTAGQDIYNAAAADIFLIKFRYGDSSTSASAPARQVFHIQPNPVAPNTAILLPDLEDSVLKIYDIYGRLVSDTSYAPSIPGIYLVQIYRAGRLLGVQKLVVVK